MTILPERRLPIRPILRPPLRTSIYTAIWSVFSAWISLAFLVSNASAFRPSFSELGVDLLSKFGTDDRFCSWLNLCPKDGTIHPRIIRGTYRSTKRCQVSLDVRG